MINRNMRIGNLKESMFQEFGLRLSVRFACLHCPARSLSAVLRSSRQEVEMWFSDRDTCMLHTVQIYRFMQ